MAASRTGDTYFLHAANTDMHEAQTIKLAVEGKPIKKATIYYIDADPEEEIGLINPHCFDPKTLILEGDTVTLPAAAVAAIEIATGPKVPRSCCEKAAAPSPFPAANSDLSGKAR